MKYNQIRKYISILLALALMAMSLPAALAEEAPASFPGGAEAGEVPSPEFVPGIPANLRVLQSGASKVSLSWDAVEGAEKYELQRSVDGGAWARVKYVTENSSYNSSLSAGVNYAYRVRACAGEQLGEFSESASLTIAHVPARVTGLALEQNGTKNVSIRWDAAEHADYYELWRNVDDALWAKVKNVTGCETLNYSLAAGSRYSYRLRGVRVVSEIYTAYGPWSEEAAFALTVSTPPAQVTGLAAVQSGVKNVSLSWDEIEGAEYYELWRNVDGALWTKVKNVTGCETLNYSLSAGVEYGYKVRAVKGGLYGAYSDLVSFRLADAPGPVENLQLVQVASRNVYLSWDAVEHADYYELWRSVDGAWAKVKNVTGTSTYNYSLNAAAEYAYRVRAVRRVTQSHILSGAWSEDCPFRLASAPGVIQGLAVSPNGTKHAYLEWAADPDADYYELWRSVGGGAWTKVKNVTGNSTYNYTLSYAVEYGYKLRGVNVVSEQYSIYGGFSDPVTITRYHPQAPARVEGLAAQQAAETAVALSWNASEGALYYEVERNGGDGWTGAAQLAQTSCMDENLRVAGSYCYRVRGVGEAGGAAVYGAYSEEISITLAETIPVLGAVSGLNARQSGETGVILSWDAVENARYYEIEYSADESAFSALCESDACSVELEGFELEIVHAFRVRAVWVSVGGEKHYGEYGEASIELKPVIGAISGLTAQAQAVSSGFPQVHISWSPARNANGYRVEVSIDGGEWRELDTFLASGGETESYTAAEIEFDAGYAFRVSGVILERVSLTEYDLVDVGPCSAAAEITIGTVVAPPEGLEVTDVTQGDITICWEGRAEDEKYILYSYSGGNYWKISEIAADSEKTDYEATLSPADSMIWGVKVAAVRTVDGVEYRSAPADGGMVLRAAVENLRCGLDADGNVIWKWDGVYGVDGVRYELLNGAKVLATVDAPGCIEPQKSAIMSRSVRPVVEIGGERVVGSASPVLTVVASKLKPIAVRLRENGADGNIVQLSWEAIPGATEYEIYRSDAANGSYSLVGSTADTAYADASAGYDAAWYYKLRYALGDYGYSNYSNVVEVTTGPAPAEVGVRRAFLVANGDYGGRQNPLNSYISDRDALSNMLTGSGYSVSSCLNAVSADVQAGIETLAAAAGEEDISLFYFFGHGDSSSPGADAGALCMADNELLTLTQLAEWLSHVPGRVIVLLQSCGGGAAVYEKGDGEAPEAFDALAFNQSAVSAFRAVDTIDRTGELRSSKFHVLTTSAYMQEGVGTSLYGYFSYKIVEGGGYRYAGGTYTGAMPADVNGDQKMTMQETYDYIYDYCYQNGDGQEVQLYPANSSLALIDRSAS